MPVYTMSERTVLLSYISPVRGRSIRRAKWSEVEKMLEAGTAVKSRALPGHLYEQRLVTPKTAEPENPAEYETRVMKPETNHRPSRRRRQKVSNDNE